MPSITKQEVNVMSALSRDDFIAMMTQELQRQEHGIGLAELPPRSTEEIFQKLVAFDFPILSIQELSSLKEEIEKCFRSDSVSKHRDKGSFQFTLTGKLMANLVYLGDSKQASEDAAFAEAARKLCILIYLMCPSFLLKCDKQGLKPWFRVLATSMDDDDDVEMEEAALKSESASEITWCELMKKFASFVKALTASSLCPSSDKGWFIDALRDPEVVKSVEHTLLSLKALASAHHDRNDSKIKPSTNLGGHATNSLLESMLADAELPSADCEEGKQLAAMTHESWLHYVFLCRDIIIQCPSLVGTWMPHLLKATMSEEETLPGCFPNAKECLTILVCSNISSTLTSDFNSIPGQHGRDLVLSRARESLRTIFSTKGNITLDTLVDVCRRMMSRAGDGGAEAAMFLVDMTFLYLDGCNMTRAKLHQSLIESHALVVVTNMIKSALNTDSHAAVRGVLPRLLHVLSVACLQLSTTASYAIRLPAVLHIIRTSLQIFQKDDINIGIQPAELIPLLLGLLQTETSESNIIEIRSNLNTVVDMTEASLSLNSVELPSDVANEVDTDPDDLSRKKKVVTVLALIRVFQVLVLQQTGGLSALEELTVSDKHGVLSLLRNLLLNSAKDSNRELKKVSKSALSYLEGNSRTNKTD